MSEQSVTSIHEHASAENAVPETTNAIEESGTGPEVITNVSEVSTQELLERMASMEVKMDSIIRMLGNTSPGERNVFDRVTEMEGELDTVKRQGQAIFDSVMSVWRDLEVVERNSRRF